MSKIQKIIISIFLLLTITGCNNNNNNNKVEYSDTPLDIYNNLILSDLLPALLELNTIDIVDEDDNLMNITIGDFTQEQYDNYIKSCIDKEFNIDIIENDTNFMAYSKLGYEISIDYNKINKKINISIKESKIYDTVTWPKNIFTDSLPKIFSNHGSISTDNFTDFNAELAYITKEKYEEIIKSCINKGFVEIEDTDENTFSAKNKDEIHLDLKYIGNNVISITMKATLYDVTLDISCRENFIFSKYDLEVYINNGYAFSIDHGETLKIDRTLPRGTNTIRFENTDDDQVFGEFTFDLTTDILVNTSLHCTSSEVIVEKEILPLTKDAEDKNIDNHNTNNKETEDENKSIDINKQIEMDTIENYGKLENKQLVSNLKKLGFENIVVEYTKTSNESIVDDSLKEILINDNKLDSERKYSKDDKIVISRWELEINESIYDKVYVNDTGSYSIYYMFDTDSNKIVTFNSDDTYVDEGTYSGSFENTLTLNWDHGEWVDKINFNNGSAILVDGNGYNFTLHTSNVESAQLILNKISKN